MVIFRKCIRSFNYNKHAVAFKSFKTTSSEHTRKSSWNLMMKRKLVVLMNLKITMYENKILNPEKIK